MSDDAEIHGKLLAFIAGEVARKEERQCTEIGLFYAPGSGYKDEQIRAWVRKDQPELFDDFAKLEGLVLEILNIARDEADTKPAGKHRFVVRTVQHLGSKPYYSFTLSPAYRGGADETALAAAGATGAKADQLVLASHAGQLMRINAQMFDSALRPLAQQNAAMLEELMTTREENRRLTRELDEARSNKLDREFQIAMAAEKNARHNAGFQKLLDIGSVIAAKIGTGIGEGAGGGGEGQAGPPSPLAGLVGQFGKSLKKEQIAVLMNTLDMSQKLMFVEIMNMVSPAEEKPSGGEEAA